MPKKQPRVEALLSHYIKVAKNESTRAKLNELLLDIKALGSKPTVGRSEAQAWVENTNFSELPLPDLVPMSVLFEHYQQDIEALSGKRDTEFPYLGFSRLLQSVDIHQVNKNRTFPVPQKPLQKYFAIRNTIHWHNATTKELRAQILKGPK